MNHSNSNRMRFRRSKGQIFVIYAILFPVLFLFLGLGIDVALIYTSKARLSRAIDATALRLTRKFEEDQARRQNITVQFMKLNYPGFFSNGYSVEVTGDVNTVETMHFRGNLGPTDDYLKVITRSESDTGVVRVELAGRSKHRTFFMPLAGEGFRQVNFVGNATADRFPALNVLVLDISGSMRSGA
ncbi:MAG: pilus assembly protein TadG-related protein, partial [Verrucomicrobiia bacterium]